MNNYNDYIIKTIKTHKNTYNIILIEKPEKINIFLDYLENFYTKNKLHKNTFVSIDYEYHNHINRLWQVCFYNKNHNNTIFVIDSDFINKSNINIIIEQLYISYIYKIFHGGDSLDFPYVFSLIKNPEKISKFLSKSIDTRFLCEYYKIILNNNNKKCSIYDAMLYFGALKQSKFDELEIMNKKIGPIWKVSWDLDKISENLLTYTIYDVILLKKLLIKIYKKYKKKNMLEEFNNIQKVNKYVLIKRNNIEYNYKLNIKNPEKYKIIDFFKNILD
jgi:hypothetical protein